MSRRTRYKQSLAGAAAAAGAEGGREPGRCVQDMRPPCGERQHPWGDLAAESPPRYALLMNQLSPAPRVYQLRIVLRGISPLIWRRLLVCSDTTPARLGSATQVMP